MKYIILNKSESECTIAVTSHTSIERELLEMARLYPAKYKGSMMSHYQKALEICINKDALFLRFVDNSAFPSPVKISYQIGGLKDSQGKNLVKVLQKPL
jgi:hypothetical protein